MKRGVIPIIAAAVIALVGAACSCQVFRLEPLSQSELAKPAIYAYKDWQSIGLQVNVGDVIYIRAEGQWLYTPGEYHGPEGHHQYLSPDTYPINAIAGGTLIGKIGEGTSGPFIVGKGRTIVADRPGFLYLRINDDILSDNDGYVTVEVTVTHPTPQP